MYICGMSIVLKWRSSRKAQSKCQVLLHSTHACIGVLRVLTRGHPCFEHLDCEVSMIWCVSLEFWTSLDSFLLFFFRVVTRDCFTRICVLANFNLFSACWICWKRVCIMSIFFHALVSFPWAVCGRPLKNFNSNSPANQLFPDQTIQCMSNQT